ncbi:hypothetical protein VOLCADRAFT_107340 [Volvox carteri f. nagariensis]|uniref:Uncharacterized protein n=1 Tax=Volvox carteri f. nagariensis TaxID=3068 RepID=D8UDD8_VOLCA|nr:uncharacterized protein VOLCADRAFT_107340 [Volvox carteri f. nagariensis]EFJ42247.1 hypothetical protein VOLCADRAFT_107340 [Volvox carteri f. nagariensis]|eukprot:XP_002956645.1 hypothetical protein VOLCADRAFT_107340 [Volvox carteri f. nagariensis]
MGDAMENLRTTNSIRLERARHEAVDRERSAQAQSPYLAQVSTYRTRTRALDHTKLMQDPKMQDWAAIPGVRRYLPTNVPDGGPHINVNVIRYKRDADYLSTTPYDGGPKYNDEVCINNWVQERRDKNYKSGFHPKELRRGGRFATEYSTRYLPSSQEFVDRVTSTYNASSRFQGLSRIGPTGIADPVFPKKAYETSGEHVFYVKDGFGVSPHQDHTTETKRGSFWVGTAAPAEHDTVTHSTMRRETLEFQRRCKSEDPRSQVLSRNKPLPFEDEGTLKVREGLKATNTFERQWKTIYQSDHIDYSRRPATVS